VTGLTFHDPWWLASLAALPLVVWWRRRPRAVGALTVSRLPAAAAGRWRLHLPFVARLLAASLVILALARPQLGYAWEESLTEGIDIQVVLDVSGSMGAEDFAPRNRLHVAKQVVRDFVARRPADRIGLTVFAGKALTRAPLTTDRQMLDFLVDSLELNQLPDGTAIGLALANAAARLEASEAKSKVIVLVTDGVNNAGAIDPLSATAICAGLGIRVYTVGVGTGGRAPVPLAQVDPLTGERRVRRVMMEVEVDEALLAEIARRTGGATYRATNSQALASVFAEIDRLETTPIRTKRYVRYREAFPPLVWTGLALLLAPVASGLANVTVEP
jgi:Ca-activated chloride channel family protein